MKAIVLASLLLIFFPPILRSQSSRWEGYDFSKADSIAALYHKHSLKDLKLLANRLTGSLYTEEEKFRVIYKWVCNDIDYDYPLFRLIQHKRTKLQNSEDRQKWNREFSALVFRNLISKQRTVCSGYAYLVRELSTYAGLSCIIVDGYGRTSQANLGGNGVANHSWNAVRINDKWYLCDPTWSAGTYNTVTSTYIRRFDDAYFLADPASFIRNHYPLDSSWILLVTKPTLGEFLRRPLIYSASYKYKVAQLFPETFEVSSKKGASVSFYFTSEDEGLFKKADLEIIHPDRNESDYLVFEQAANDPYCLDYVFTSRGLHVLHLRLDESYIATYRVTVN